MLFLLNLKTEVYADDYTYNQNDTKKGYHLEEYSTRECYHSAENSEYVVTDFTGLYPTKEQLIANTKITGGLKGVIGVQDVNGSLGEGSVSGLQAFVALENVNFGVAGTITSHPYTCPHDREGKVYSGYIYLYQYFSWCPYTETYYHVAAAHRWHGCVVGDVGESEYHEYGYEHIITLYKYIPNSYTIKFDANGGTGSMEDISCMYDSEYILTQNTFGNKGYVFAGWNTKADGTGEKYNNKATIKNLSSVDGSSITLYAQWSKEGWLRKLQRCSFVTMVRICL